MHYYKLYIFLLFSALFLVGPAAAQTFSNTSSITINDAGANPTPASVYPSTINVVGVSGTISKITVTLHGFSHLRPDDVDMLLVGPSGENIIIWSDAGGTIAAVNNITVTLDDAAASNLPDISVLTSGTFRPTNYTPALDPFAAPAPAPAASTMLSVFNGTSPNGTWSLYIVDDIDGGAGSISGGWSLSLTVNASPVVTTTPGTTAFTAPGAVAVDAGITVTDPNQATLPSATVTITSGLQTAHDILSFTNNNAATYGNIAASYNAATGTLALSSASATASIAQWQAALRAVMYNNSSGTPNKVNRVVSFVANDGNNESNVATKTVSVSRSSAASDYFRSVASGNWSSVATWESSPDGANWYQATLVPGPNSTMVTIENSHAVMATGDVTVNKLTINAGGVLNTNNGVKVTVLD